MNDQTNPPPARGDLMHEMNRTFDALFGAPARADGDKKEGGE